MISFDITKSIEVLERTPVVLKTLLSGLSDEWILHNEGGDSFSPYDVVGHLLHGETSDWVQRTKIILSDSKERTFKPFDRFAQFEESKGKSLNEILDAFAIQRAHNISFIKSLHLDEAILVKKGVHPAFGEVSLQQLLATWVAHDLGHIGQIVRVMAKQYKHEVGPWVEYLRILKD